jgi:hypothetical protein
VAPSLENAGDELTQSSNLLPFQLHASIATMAVIATAILRHFSRKVRLLVESD